MENKTLKFRFQRAPGVTVVPITGYWVYQTAESRVLCDLFHERPQPTLSVTHALNPDGTLGKETSRDVSEEVVREILASVDMSAQTAFSLGMYLVEVARQMGVVEAQQSGSQKVH